MHGYLRHVDPDNVLDVVDRAKAYGGDSENLVDLCFDALHLVDSAAAFFRGVFPSQSVHFWWGESINLPWCEEYRFPSADGQFLSSRPIRAEAERLAAEVHQVWETHVEGGSAEPAWGVSYSSETLTSSPMILMKALSVEVMLSVEGFLDRVNQGDQALAMRWLAAAFKGIIECTCQAQQILGNPSENARIAAQARHRENHDMKRQVFAWLDENFGAYKSMDSAAEAIAGRVVPVKFRTARDWVGQWRQRVPPARTP